MKINQNEILVREYQAGEWEFHWPEAFDLSSDVTELFWSAVDLLDEMPESSEQTFKNLITKYPDYLDAYNHLAIAYQNQRKNFECDLVTEKAYLLGKSYIPKELKLKKNRLGWYHLGNRPFLRACAGYGLMLQKRKDFESAMQIYNEILGYNPNDNQGIRYLLLECLFVAKNYKNVRKLLNYHQEEHSIEMSYGLVALEVLEGNIAKAQVALKKASDINPFFINEMQKSKHTPPSEIYDFGGVPMGSALEAHEYWKSNKSLYNQKLLIAFYKALKSDSNIN